MGLSYDLITYTHDKVIYRSNPTVKSSIISFSFQSDQDTKITKESKPRLSTLGSCFRVSVHQKARLYECVLGMTPSHPVLRSTLNQTSREKEQIVRRWSIVSGIWAHSTQVSSSCKPCLFRRAAVQYRSWSTSQMKNLHLAGARALRSNFAPSIGCCPMKKAMYAEEVEKILSDVHLQHIMSGWFSDNWI